MRFFKRNKFFMFAVVFVLLLCCFPARPAKAAGLIAPAEGRLRAKIEYDCADGISQLDDDLITFSAHWGTKQEDGWYYYGYPVKSGDSVTFIEGVTFPTTWTEKVQNKDFSIIVTVEAAEVTSTNTINWDGRLKVSIDEYQVDENGIWSAYENDQIITPGQFVSKIVVFTLQQTLVRQTGDNMSIFLYGGIFSVSAIGLIYILCHRKKAALGGLKNI